ncbi:MAG: HD domain-containing protein [Bacilli bacterium]|nr:HD domain-containing protein [Bacilli bacterium]
MIEEVRKKVYELLKNDDSGHGIAHIERVFNLSIKFAKKENADVEITSLIALLHEVDDYKLFGEENAKNLTNAKRIMREVNIDKSIQKEVIAAIENFGYSKAIQGIRPRSLEGKIVSDADMCDAVGVNGLIRIFTYSLKYGKPFFDKNKFPNSYLEKNKKICADSSVCHLFEKALKLKNMMLTSSGKREIEKRHNITVEMLYQLFDEEDAEDWIKYLDDFLTEYYS